ncbi:hypothetical protein [Natrinema sp. DC36]|uniref:hypothetical protein n=1 Tax=Natrinema sp. DC36 TaxID=2878680 RepID=UPI001CF0534B|nr:hypothetical protein [Natrinema sp. DC36]
MNRRRLLEMAGASSVLGMSGCFYENRESTLESKASPAPPERLTPDSIVDFVEEYETVERYNRLLSDYEDPEQGFLESIDISCNAVFDRETASGSYALTLCAGSITTSHSISDRPSAAFGVSAYRVTETRVQRVTASRVGRHAIRSRAGQEDDYTLLFVNFDAVEHDLTAVVTSPAESIDEPILEASYTIDSGEGIERRLERTEATRYDVTVRLDGETRATLEDGQPRSVGATSYISDDEIEIGTFSAIP